ncbi:MAG TPA: SAM-dependent methyltransferase [Alphaproteobacteria bacterium]|nr:SAM-dependent methyltransferase [Alphaproteobacteria bacterium]
MKNNPTLLDWLDQMRGAVRGGSFVKFTLTKPVAGGDLKSVDVRPIMVKRELKLSFTFHHTTRDVVKNYDLDASTDLAAQLLRDTFTAGRLFTLQADVAIAKHAAGYTLTRQPPSQTKAPELTHNRAKNHLLAGTGKSYLHALGLADAQGNVLKSANDKFRQINKYIEILDGLVKQLPPRQKLTIVDMGAGKGYLTFALYDHLANTLKLNAHITGVEYRAELVELCNTIAADAKFENLRFVQGGIAGYDCTGVDVVIALHACDTATDDAIAKAINAHAALIVVAPCCHKQVRQSMPKPTATHPLHFVLQHGTYAERMADMVTDSLRAQLMELNGYNTKLFEFISDAHTPKNVMIVGQKTGKSANAEKLKAAIAAAKAQFGLETHYLETLLTAR